MPAKPKAAAAPGETTVAHQPGTPAAEAPTAAEVSEATQAPFADVPAVPPLPVEVHGPVHTVPNPAQHVEGFVVTSQTANKPFLLIGKNPKMRACLIISHATGSDYVNLNGRQMSTITDGAGRLVDGASLGFDGQGPFWACATSAGVAVSVFVTLEDG